MKAGNGRDECALPCQQAHELHDLDMRMLAVERDMGTHIAEIREIKEHWREQMKVFAGEVTRLQDCVAAIAKMLTL
jgi:hypothetical protein